MVVGKNRGNIMIEKSEKLCLTLLLSIALINFSNTETFANNTLNQIDVRKNSSDGLEFTLYTSSPYADNVVVTKKSDNKYVILMPNVNGSSTSKPDFAAVKDVVTDIDVRAVDDTGNGYTKVTVITNRPVNIKTNTLKSTAPTEGQKEYRALIAQQQAKAYTPKAAVTTSNATATTTKTAVKLPEIQPTKVASDAKASKTTTTTQKTSQAVQKQATVPSATSKIAQNTPAKTETKVVETQKKVTPIKNISNKTVEQPKSDLKPAIQKTTEQQVKNVTPAQENTAKEIPTEEKTTQNLEAQPQQQSPVTEVAPTVAGIQQEFTPKNFSNNILADIKNKFSGRIPENMPVTLALILIPFICIMVLFNIIKNSLQRSQMLKKVLMENMARRQNETEQSSYDNIINNENLSWQEKYQQYREIANEVEQIEEEHPQYHFIAKPQNINQASPIPNAVKPSQNFYAKGVIKNSNKNKTVNNLEKILQISPDVEKTDITKDIQESETSAKPDIIAEDHSIHKEMVKSIKFKAFEEKMILEETQRNKKVKHRRIQIELPKEAPQVNLGYSKLHSNPRNFKNATLSVSDLIARSNKLLSNSIINEEPAIVNDYETISIDEYLNILDEEKPKATSKLSSAVAEKLSKRQEGKKDSQPMPKSVVAPKLSPANAVPAMATNPITSLRNETKEDYLSGLIIKSGFNIDNERGFYLVSMDGKSAVIGKIGEEIFVLKKFDRSINKPLQVRMDNPNVYMVKADNFKSLVEVRKNSMDVLIEL